MEMWYNIYEDNVIVLYEGHELLCIQLKAIIIFNRASVSVEEDIMNIYNRIKALADARGISIASLERQLDFGNGTITKWRTQDPGVSKLMKVAEYFEVSLDWITERNIDVPFTEGIVQLNVELIARDKKGMSADRINKIQRILDAIYEKGEYTLLMPGIKNKPPKP